MTNKIFGGFVRTALAVAMLTGAQFAVADNKNTGQEVVAGSVVQLGNGTGSLAGVFNGSVMSGLSAVGSFKSFCLEKYEYFSSYTQNLYVKSVGTATVNSTAGSTATNQNGTSSSDPLSFATAYLYTQFYNSTLSNYSGNGSDNDELQKAIWALEGEVTVASLGGSGKDFDWYTEANAAGWTSLGNVRALNLFTNRSGTEGNYTYSGHSQDQLYMISAVPEPETYAMMLAGLGLMGTIARRRKAKAA